MEHHHHHVHPTPDMQKLNRSFIVGIVLNIVFVLAEAGAGFYYDSLALLSDAGHNLSDVVILVFGDGSLCDYRWLNLLAIYLWI